MVISFFQALDNYYAHRRQDRQGKIITAQAQELRDLSDRIHADDDFFAAVRQLIILGPSATDQQRQEIIDTLKAQDAARQAREQAVKDQAAANQGKASGGSVTTSPPKSNSSQPSSTTTTTRPSSPPSSSPPPSEPPAVQACVRGTCVTVPPVTLPRTPPVTILPTSKRRFLRYE